MRSLPTVEKSTDTFDIFFTKFNNLIALVNSSVLTTNSTVGGVDITTGNASVNGIFSANTTAATYLRGGNVSSSDILTITSNVAVNASFLSINTASSNVYVNSSYIHIGNSTTNAHIDTAGITVANSTVSYSYILPTAAQKADGEYYLTSAGTWAQLVVGNSATYSILAENYRLPDAKLQSNTYVSASSGASQVITSDAAASYRTIEYFVSIKDNNGGPAYQSTRLLLIHDGTNVHLTEYATVTTTGIIIATFDADINAGNIRLLYSPVSTNSSEINILKTYIEV
jgi:hypothetical protein